MKLYVLVDLQLNENQRWVQGAHAVAQYVIENPGKWKNGTLVFLGCHDIESVLDSADSFFREPYYENQITAVTRLCDGAIYKDYKLL